MDDERNNRRGQDRYTRDIKVQYYLKNQSMRYQECSIKDISLTGVKIQMPRYDKVSTGSRIFLEILTAGSGEQINLNGTVKWVARHQQTILCGIQFNKKLDDNTFAKL